MSKIQAVPFVNKVVNSLTDDLKMDLTTVINGNVATPTLKTLYTIGESDIDKAQFVTLETKSDTFTGYLVYNDDYCVLFAFSPNSQDLAMVNIDVTNKTCELVKEQLNILELRSVLGIVVVPDLEQEVERLKTEKADAVDVIELQKACFNFTSASESTVIKWSEFLTFSKDSDTTFTFETAKTDCLNEYKAKITNSSNASITLTFTGIDNILCNDDDCVVLNNTIAIASGVTIEINALDGNMAVVNFEA